MNFLKWLNERTGIVSGCKTVANWTVPAGKCCCRFLPTSLVFLFLLQGLTGIFLWAFYSASATSAWESVYYVQYGLPFGWLLRGIHHYSAQLFVGLSGLYVLLLILHGSYRRPREFVYWAAIAMFLFSLCSCLTGDLLPWSLSGYFATITRVSFLQLLPVIGVPLYQLVVGGPDPQFGTLTLTRFLFLHVCVFGGGGFAILCCWKWFDIRSRKLFATEARFDGTCRCALGRSEKARRAFWSCEAVKAGGVCLLTLAAVLLLVFQHSLTANQVASRDATLPAESYLGAELTSPVDVASSYDAARPEWSFRALYHMTKLPIFSKIGMVYAIFVVPPFLLAFFLALPILGRVKPLHYLCVGLVFVLFVVFCRFTYLSYWDDYKNPEHAPGYLASKADADRLAGRAVELTFAPTGIPKTGALELIKNDPFAQGPKLFSQHCASCHNFVAKDEESRNPEYLEVECSEPTAPNLYGARTAAWIRGFTNLETLKQDDCFGKTAFAEKGSMVGFMNGRVASGQTLEDGSFMPNPLGLVAKVIAADASPAFDVLEGVFEDFVADEANVAILDKILNEDGDVEEADVEAAKAEYVAKLTELIDAKFADEEFVAGLEPKTPAAVLATLKNVLKDTLQDEKYRELLFDEENIEYVKDEDAATFLTDSYLATLNGNDEPIPAEETKYYFALRDSMIAACDSVAEILAEEAKLDAPRPFVDGAYLGLAPNALADMEFLTCTECHAFYGKENDHACDLRAYMSRDWLAGIISDPTSPKYYGARNDRMPSYCPTNGDKLMTEAEVGMLADWLSGKWYRAPEVENKTRVGKFGAAREASQAQAAAQAEVAAQAAAAKAELDAKIAKQAEEKAAADAAAEAAKKEKAEKAAADKEKRAADELKAAKEAADKANAEAKEAKAAAAKAEADAKAAVEKANDEADAKATSADQAAAESVAQAQANAQAAVEKANAERDAAKAEIKTTTDQAAAQIAAANAAVEKANAARETAEQAVADVRVAAQKAIDAKQADVDKAVAAQTAAQAALDQANAEKAELQAKLDAALAAPQAETPANAE